MAFEFKLPDIGEGLTEGEVVKWLVKLGQAVKEDEPMVEVMTDKATVEITAPTTGTIAEIRAKEGEVVPVGNVMVVIETGSAAAPAQEAAPAPVAAPAPAPAPTPAPAAAPTPAPAAAPAAAPVTAPTQPLRARTLAAPATRKLARQLGVALDAVPATGDNGRVTRLDVEAFAAAGGAAAPAPAPAAAPAAPPAAAPAPRRLPVAAPGMAREDRKVPLRGLRSKIAEQMVRSKQMSPHFTFAEECDMTNLVALREEARSSAAEYGIKLTFLPFIMKALCACFRKFPEINAVVDDTDNSYIVRGEVNIGLATDTEEGLTVVVVKRCDQLSILQIAQEIQRLTVAARDKKVALDDLKGGTFTITSAGSIGGIMATPILNYPEVGILGVYKIAKRPVVKNDEIVVRSMANMTITLDHRIVDGAKAARFMNELVRLLENPGLMLVEG